MLQRLKKLKIVQSFLLLRGNTKVSVMCEPLWGIPFTIYTFYLSLYMKEMGVTDEQLGIIIAAGFLSAAFFSPFGGIITDYLGRKRTSFIFDSLAWPIAIFVYLISRSLIMFILATVLNNLAKIVAVSWNLMVIEDADSEQRKAAFNLLNIINISLGILTPLAGLVVARYGVVKAERAFMIFAIISMTAMILIRNKYYTETRIGKQILEEQKGLSFKDVLKKGLYSGTFAQMRNNNRLKVVFLIQILFNLTLPLGAFNSMYFAPFMTEQIGIDKAVVSILGGVYAGVMLVVFLFITPAISHKHMSSSIVTGLFLQAVALIGITAVPEGMMFFAILAVALYSFGYGIFMPFFSTLIADVSEGKERAGIYSLVNTVTAVLSALIGLGSGFLYAAAPRFIFYITALLLGLCVIGMFVFIANETFQKHKN